MNTEKSAKPKSYEFSADGLDEPLRLDQAIGHFLPDVSRTQARKLITLGAAWVNDQRVQVQSRKIHNGDRVLIYKGREGWRMFYESEASRILYEDEWLLLYSKESGIPTQGIFCDNYNNLYAGLLRLLKKRGKPPYLGMHHRLDLETSGVVLFTKNKQANGSIHYQFKNRSINKQYLVVVVGNPIFDELEYSAAIAKKDGKYLCGVDIEGKSAQTFFKKLHDFEGYSLLRAHPHTGRTHQIRLHLQALGHPVLGDSMYGGGSALCARTMLHAEMLCLQNPRSRKDLQVHAPVPEDMQQLLGDYSLTSE